MVCLGRADHRLIATLAPLVNNCPLVGLGRPAL
jgi:hypothetical protein